MSDAPDRSAFSPPNPDAASQIKELESQIVDLAAQMEQCEKEARDLMAREAAGDGIHAARIFSLKQDKMRLATEMQHRKVRINALLLGL